MKAVLKQQFTRKIVFDKNSDFKPDQENKTGDMNVNLNFDISVNLRPNPNVQHEYVMDMQLAWNDARSPFLLDVVTTGVFQLIEIDSGVEIDDVELNKVLRISGADMLFPYLRERISNVTSTGGVPTLMIPPIDFNHMYSVYKDKVTLQ